MQTEQTDQVDNCVRDMLDFLVQLKKISDELEEEDQGMMYEAKAMELVLLEEE